MIIEIKNWKVVNNQEYVDYMMNVPDWLYELKKVREKRTNDQNRYLWGWVYKAIAEHIWEDEEYIHWVMWMKFLVDKTKKAPYIKSTTKLDTKEFAEYVENIRNYVAPFGIYIMSPEEFYWISGM